MRLKLVAVFALASAAFGQRGFNPIGGGNVLRPGIPLNSASQAIGPSGRFSTGARIGSGHGSARRSFGPGGTAFAPGYGAAFGSGDGDFGGADYSFDGFYRDFNSNPEPAGNDPIFGGQPGAPTPTVVINPNFRTEPIHPQFRDYSNVKLPEPGTVQLPPGTAVVPSPPPSTQRASSLADDQPTVFLIAMQDHTIHPAIAYWVKGDTLHYISVEGAPNHVSVTLVDRDFSRQLNAERNVPFTLSSAH